MQYRSNIAMNFISRKNIRLVGKVFLFQSLFLSLLWIPSIELCATELTAPTAMDRRITLMVSSLLKKDHLTKHPMDDEISQRGIERFIKSLDYSKLYFYQSDVDEFMASRNLLDNAVLKGDISFAYTVFKRYLERVDERVLLITELLEDHDFDFEIDEEQITDRDLAAYPKDKEEARDLWRKRLKHDLLMLKVDGKEGEEALEKLRKRYTSFGKRMHQFSSDELLEMYLTSLTVGYDPHTTYMSPATLENFRIIMGLKLVGIGAALRTEDGITKVERVIKGGPADKQGILKKGDKIIGVGQEEGEMVDIIDMNLSDVVKLIRGKEGKIVRLAVVSEGDTKSKILTIIRGEIELKESEAKGKVFEVNTQDQTKKIGVINLPSFYLDMVAAQEGKKDFKNSTDDVKKILDDFKVKGVDAVVVDLSDNGGGSLTEAIRLTGLFIDKGTVVQVKDAKGDIEKYDDYDRGMAWSGPLVVVIGKHSASASEIFAGAIQDYGRGIVVGGKTHGKGTVQGLKDLGQELFNHLPNPPNMGALKITMSQFYRPGGDSTQIKGVEADIELPSLAAHMFDGEESLDHYVGFDRIDAAKFQPFGEIDENMVKELRRKSAKRRKKSEEFAELKKDIKLYKNLKDIKTVSLNEKKFFAQRKKQKLEEEEEDKLNENGPEGDDLDIERDFYLDEVLSITADYVSILKGNMIVHRLVP